MTREMKCMRSRLDAYGDDVFTFENSEISKLKMRYAWNILVAVCTRICHFVW